MYKATLILLALATVQASATVVNECGSLMALAEDKSVTIAGCYNPPCKMKSYEKVDFSVKFTPSSRIDKLIAYDEATKWGVSSTLINNVSVCNKVFKVSDSKPAGCPLSPGVEYIYKDKIDIPYSPVEMSGNVKLKLYSDSEDFKCYKAAVDLINN